MSGRGDIRMYVEHLFEGRTLDAETIELKEEIYGNLTARFDDYVAQGMSEAEAFSRTCEAVTSVDDVLGGDGEKNAEAAGGEKDDAGADAEATRVAPVAAPVPPGAEGASQPQGGRSRWSTGKVVGAVAAVIVAAVAIVTVVNVLNSAAASVAYDEGTVDVQAVDETDASTTYPDAGRDATSGSGTGTDATSVNQNGTLLLETTYLVQEVRDHDPSALLGMAGATWTEGGTELAEAVSALPLAGYVSSVGSVDDGTGAKIALVEYSWTKDDRLARTDDDAVERALAYDVAALLCTFPNVDTLQVQLLEIDAEDGERDLDTYRFRRTDLEQILGTSLTADRLTDGTWNDLRAQLSTERYYDRICDRAERD